MMKIFLYFSTILLLASCKDSNDKKLDSGIPVNESIWIGYPLSKAMLNDDINMMTDDQRFIALIGPTSCEVELLYTNLIMNYELADIQRNIEKYRENRKQLEWFKKVKKTSEQERESQMSILREVKKNIAEEDKLYIFRSQDAEAIDCGYVIVRDGVIVNLFGGLNTP